MIALRRIVLALIVPVATAQTQQRAPDFTLAIRIGTDTTATVERLIVAGPRTRMEFQQDPPNPVTSGMYMVVDSRDSSMMSVVPSARMATVISVPSAPASSPMATLSTFLAGVKRSITSEKLEDMGPGGTLLGQPTHKYRVSRIGTITGTHNGKSCERKLSAVEDLWIIDDTTLGKRIIDAEARFAPSMGTLEMSAKSMAVTLDSASRIKMPKGFRARTITHELDPATGRIQMTSIEFTEFSTASVDTTLFRVPSDYEVQDMRAMMAGVQVPDFSASLDASVDKAMGCG